MSSISFNQTALTEGVRRRLETSTRSLTRVFERLSSGQRINHASDDAAGLAVFTSLNLKSAVYNQGLRNISDGTSLFSIHEQALSSLGDIVTRQLELAQQSANGVFTESQRSALNNEAQALSSEYSRILQSTSFNGINLLSGGQDGISIQAGMGNDATLNLKFLEETEYLANSSQTLSMLGTAGPFTTDVRFMVFEGDDGKDTLVALSLTSIGGRLALRVESFRTDSSGVMQRIDSFQQDTGVMEADLVSGTFRAVEGPGNNLAMTIAMMDSGGNRTNVNLATTVLGTGAFGTFGIGSQVVIDQSSTLASGNFTGLGQESVSSAGVMTPLGFNAYLLKQEFGIQSLEQLNFSLLSSGSSLAAIDTLQSNLDLVNSVRGKIGAVQSRLDVAFNVLSVQEEQSRAAASRIQDTDIAADTSELVRQSILQEAGAAVLAQAGLQAELALILLDVP